VQVGFGYFITQILHITEIGLSKMYWSKCLKQ